MPKVVDPKRNELVIELYKKKVPQKRIAELLGISTFTVGKIRRESNIPPQFPARARTAANLRVKSCPHFVSPIKEQEQCDMMQSATNSYVISYDGTKRGLIKELLLEASRLCEEMATSNT